MQMRIVKSIRVALVAAACIGMVFPRAALAEIAAAEATHHEIPVSLEMEHVVLHDSGVLQGALVDTDGRPVEGQTVLLAKAGTILMTATTNEEGRYAFRGVEEGVYQIVSTGKAANYRVYSSNAPADAKQGVIHVLSPEMARANLGGRPGGTLNTVLGRTSRTALYAAAFVVAVSAVAIAVNEDDNS